jgi:hypothetical protein
VKKKILEERGDIYASSTGEVPQTALPSYQCGRLYGKPLFEGGCGKPVSFEESYRCYDCTASFHRDCIREHFHRSEQIGDKLTIKDALIECLSWMECECGHPSCKRCRATREALEVLARTAQYPPSVPMRNENHAQLLSNQSK